MAEINNSLGQPQNNFNLRVNELGEPLIENVYNIEFEGATVTDEGGNKVKVEITSSGSSQNLQQLYDASDPPIINAERNDGLENYLKVIGFWQEGSVTFNSQELIEGVSSNDGIDYSNYSLYALTKVGIGISNDYNDETNLIFSTGRLGVDNGKINIIETKTNNDGFTTTSFGIEDVDDPDGDKSFNWKLPKDEDEGIIKVASRKWVEDNFSSGDAVDSVNGQTGDVVLNANDIGLGNVDNTSDADKPISDATQTALNEKTLPLISDGSVTAITGVNVPTIMYSVQIPANLLNDYNRLVAQIQITKSSGVGSSSILYYINSSNSLTGATQIAITSITSAIQFASLERKFKINGTNLSGYPFTASAATDSQNSSASRSSTAYDTTNAMWFIVAVNPASIAESHLLESVEINARRRKTTI